MRRSESDGRQETPCFEMLLPCKSIETTHAAACVISPATMMRRSVSDGRPEPPCIEMLPPCKSIETTIVAACESIIGKGDGGDGEDDAQERERRQARDSLL